MRALSGTRAAPQSDDPLVQGAMAHLNRVMIHPFGDGNGRMARALHAMEMAQDQVVEQTFCSIEEWLANITQDLYDVLAATGCGSWQSGNDAKLWVKFKLSAHHMQAKTMRRPFNETEPRWRLLRSCLRSTS